MTKLLTTSIVVIFVGAVAVFAAVRSVTPPAAVEVAALKSTPQRMTLADGALYWLELDGDLNTPSRLVQLRLSGGQSRALLSGAKIKSYAVAGQDVYFTEENSSAVKRLSTNGGQPIEVVRNAQNPGEVYADDKYLYWTETAPAALPFAPYVPVANYISTIHRASHDGSSPRVLAAVESTASTFNGRFLGRWGDSLYWMEWLVEWHGDPMTVVRRVNDEGKMSLVSLGGGQRDCVLHDDSLYCVTTSDEGSPPMDYAAVKRIPLREGPETTLTDWLTWGGTLAAAPHGVYYFHRNRVWSVPETLRESEVVAKVEEGESVCYLHDGSLFSYNFVGKTFTLKRRAFKPRNWLVKFWGLGM